MSIQHTALNRRYRNWHWQVEHTQPHTATHSHALGRTLACERVELCMRRMPATSRSAIAASTESETTHVARSPT